MKTRILRCLLAMAFAATAASAQQMNYQGRLTNNAGAPRPGPQATLNFSMWTLPTGGTQVWGDFALNAELIDGRFSVKLGDVTGADGNGNLLSTAFATNPGPRYLEIKVGTVTPKGRLHVVGPPAPGMTFGSSTGILFGVGESAGNYGLYFGTNGDGKSWIQGGRTDALAIPYDISLQASGGNVGIGTTQPIAKLDVAGNINTTGNIRENGQHVPSAGEDLRIVRGNINAIGPR